MKIKSMILLMLFVASVFTSCASAKMSEDDIDWENTRYCPIDKGGYLPEKWAKQYYKGEREFINGIYCCYYIIPLPVGIPLLIHGNKIIKKFTAESKKEKYYIAYQKQLARDEYEKEMKEKQMQAEINNYMDSYKNSK